MSSRRPPGGRKGLGGGEKSTARNEKRSAAAKVRPVRSAVRVGRLLLNTGKLLVVLAITAAVFWAGMRAYDHATNAEYFAVNEVEVTGASRLERQEVLQAAGFTAGMNVFRIDTQEMSRALARHPWIADASVRRRIPQSVAIEIRERRPEALVLFDMPYLVDDSGEVFKRWAPGDPVPVPVITGFSREQFILDGESVIEGVREAIAFARRYRASGLEAVAPLAEVHREADDGLTIVAGEDPFRVKLGAGPYRRKLERLALLLGRTSRDGLRPAVIYLDNEVRPDRVTIRAKPDRTPRPEVSVEPRAHTGKMQSKI